MRQLSEDEGWVVYGDATTTPTVPVIQLSTDDRLAISHGVTAAIAIGTLLALLMICVFVSLCGRRRAERREERRLSVVDTEGRRSVGRRRSSLVATNLRIAATVINIDMPGAGLAFSTENSPAADFGNDTKTDSIITQWERPAAIDSETEGDERWKESTFVTVRRTSLC